MDKKTSERLPLFQIVIIVLSIYVLAALAISTFFKLTPEIHKLLDYIDNCICYIFLTDFVYRFWKAKSKLGFMRWGWIDLVSSIPSLEIFRAGRMLRLVRLFRILRAFRSTKILMHHIFKKKTYGAITVVSIFAILMIIFSSIAILQVEDASNSNILTAEDALWWACSTITTVGYGDKYPVTSEGRLIAVLVMTVGVGLFGTITGFVASWFVEERQIEHEKEVEQEV